MGDKKKKEKKPNGYWTKEMCAEEALKYKNRSEFRKTYINAYNKSIKMSWINKFFPK